MHDNGQQEVRASASLQLVLSAVSLFYFIYNAAITIPASPLFDSSRDPLRTLWQFWGLEQNWKLFSPEIRKINYHTVGIVTYKNGFKEIWEVPRLNKLDLGERISKDKFRKWGIDSLPWSTHKGYWPDLARFIGRSRFTADNPPAQFSLILLWTDGNPPEALNSRDQMPIHSKPSHVFTYNYGKDDFQTR